MHCNKANLKVQAFFGLGLIAVQIEIFELGLIAVQIEHFNFELGLIAVPIVFLIF